MIGAAPSRLLRFASATLRQLWPPLSWRSATLWLVVAINVVFVVLYFWSRGGATTEVRIEAIGSGYRAFVDGRLIAEADFAGPEEGGIGFLLIEADRHPSLPKPSGIDSVRVTDAATGELLLEDSFSGSPSGVWEMRGDTWSVSDGVLSTSRRALLATGFRPWRDYILEAKLRNVADATISVRMEDPGNEVTFRFRPYRDYDGGFLLHEEGAVVDRQPGVRLQLDRGQTIRSIAAMLLRPYPVAALMIVGAIVLALTLRLPWVGRQSWAAGKFVASTANTIAIALAAGAFVLLWYLIYVVGDAIPKVPDSVLYVFEAKIFASFNITADAPPVFESFSIFSPHFLHVVDGRWFSQYPFGHPLFLSIGQFFGAVWLVPPALGAGSVLLIYLVGKRVYGVMTGLIAAVVLLFSPFFQMTASNFMSHNTAAFVIFASLFFLTRPMKRPMLSMFLSGVFLGLLFNIRPLTAVAFIPVLGAFLAYELLRAGEERGKVFREDLAFAAGGLLLLLAYFLYNQATTGSFTESPYTLTAPFSSDALGFGGGHSVAIGIQNEQVLASLIVLAANGWPVAIGLVFAALPFLLGTRHRWDYFLAGSALAIAAATIFYRGSGIMHGPRYWYETMPFLMLLTGRGAQCLRDAGSTVGDWFAGRVGWMPSASTSGATGFAVTSLVVGLVAFSAWGWMLERRDTWPEIRFMPGRISELEGFNFTDRRLLDAAGELDLENALVFVESSRGIEGEACFNWWCYGSVFWTNSPDLDSEIVWARRQHNSGDVTLIEHFEGREIYVAIYGSGSIRPVTSAAIIRDAEARIAEEVEEELSPEDRDLIRRLHLETLRQALERYATEAGAFPDTGGLRQTLCAFPDLDAGCILATVLPELPIDPLGGSYWYLSDGTSFVLLAKHEVLEVDETQCPEQVPNLSGAGRVYCVTGPAP